MYLALYTALGAKLTNRYRQGRIAKAQWCEWKVIVEKLPRLRYASTALNFLTTARRILYITT